MAKLKRLLTTSAFETAQRERKCSRNNDHKISKGDLCLTVKENMAKRSYCVRCARLILEKAREEVLGLLLQLPPEG